MAIGSLPKAPLRLGRRLLDNSIVDALVTPSPIERYIDLIDPTWSRRDVRAQITSVKRQSPRSVTITLKPNANWRGFKAGQHIGVTTEIDGALTTRFYSPANSAANSAAHSGAKRTGELELTITEHPSGKVSEHLVKHARPGMVLGLSPAEGEFVLPKPRPQRLLLISGGSGITPVMSILRTLCDEGHTGPIAFVHYARAAEDALYAEELKALEAEHQNLTLVRVFTRDAKAPATDGVPAGHFTRKQLKAICPDFARASTYVCGPNELVAAVEKLWKTDGLTKKLSSEAFVLPEPVVVAGDATGKVRFTGSEKVIDNDGRTLLAQAEDAGLTPRCGCRMGICHTCITHMESGSVRNVRTGEVKTVSDELVQICVNAPVGDVEINL